MRTISLFPSRLGVGTGRFSDRAVGILTFVGSGDMAEVVLEVVVDSAALAQLEAEISEARDQLRSASAR